MDTDPNYRKTRLRGFFCKSCYHSLMKKYLWILVITSIFLSVYFIFESKQEIQKTTDSNSEQVLGSDLSAVQIDNTKSITETTYYFFPTTQGLSIGILFNQAWAGSSLQSPIEVGVFDTPTSYKKIFATSTISDAVVLSDGVLLTDLQQGNLYYKKWDDNNLSFLGRIPILQDSRNFNFLSLVAPSPNNNLIAVSSEEVAGYDFPPTLFIVNPLEWSVRSYLEPQPEEPGGVYVTAGPFWLDNKTLSFGAGIPKDCSGWWDGFRFSLDTGRFSQTNSGRESSSVSWLKVWPPSSSRDKDVRLLGSKFLFSKNDDGMCGSWTFGGISIVRDGNIKNIFDQTKLPIEIRDISWVNGNHLVFKVSTYESKKVEIMNYETEKKELIDDVGKWLYDTYYVYDYEKDQLRSFNSLDEGIASITGGEYQKYTIISSWDKKGRHNHLQKEDGYVDLPDGKITFPLKGSPFNFYTTENEILCVEGGVNNRIECKKFYKID